MMPERDDKPIRKAVIIFSDIVDSSVYSSIMGIEQYGRDLIKFQDNFMKLASAYFNKPNAIKIDAEGDEGVIFYILEDDELKSPSTIIYRAIEFAYMLKATMELVIGDGADVVPRKMHVGTGVHLGDVATVLNATGEIGKASNISDIKKILGYSINYAKRVESATRIGEYSKIFISKTASTYLWEFPVVLKKYKYDLKGISKSEDVFEVRSAYFMKLELDKSVEHVDNFLYHYVTELHKLDFINEPWLKGFIISVLDSVAGNSKYESIKGKYANQRPELAWRYFSEDDPILLMMRAHDCEDQGNNTRRLSILKEVIHSFPDFAYAKIAFVKAVASILDEKVLPAELVYARDIANELLGKYDNVFVSDNMRTDFKTIVDKIEPKLRAH